MRIIDISNHEPILETLSILYLYITCAGGEAIDKVAYVKTDILRICYEAIEVKTAMVMKVKTSDSVQSGIHGSLTHTLHLGEVVHHLLVSRFQDTVQSSEYRQREDYLTIVRLFIVSTQQFGYPPYNVCFRFKIGHYCDLILSD